jgi:hypothetical protein
MSFTVKATTSNNFFGDHGYGRLTDPDLDHDIDPDRAVRAGAVP